MNKQGEFLLSQGKFREAKALFLNEVDGEPADALAHIGLAHSFIGLGQLEEALTACQAAIELDPNLLLAYGTLGSVYQRLGRFDEAISCSRKAIAIQPQHFKPYVEIVRCSRINSVNSDLVEKLNEMVNEKRRPDADKFHIHWALGKANDDLGNYEIAIGHFDSASRIIRQREASYLAYNRKAREQEAEFIKSIFPPDLFDASPVEQTESGPILIVGMIRSGTTLLDAILSRYPGIASAGELLFWEQEAGQIIRSLEGTAITKESYSASAKRYERVLKQAQPDAETVIDKMPNNYRHLGLIHLAMPNAKIIHLRRHPVDTCLSIFSTDFGPRPPQFAYNRSNIVHAYRIYKDLMDYWRTTLPSNSFLEVDYENLVESTEATLRQILDYLKLPWSAALLESGSEKGDVVTPSRWQARQPIYRSSLERWKCYQPWLGEFVELMPNS